MSKIDIERLININSVKYDRLIDITKSAFVNSNADTINIYIDLYSILKPLYKTDSQIVDYTVVTSCIINMCAHYREFYKTRYNTWAKFYIVYSENCCDINNQFQYNYNISNKNLFESNNLFHDMILRNLKLLNILCPYLPDIFFVSGTFETGVIIYDLILRNIKDNGDVPHMILTKDPYIYQLVHMRTDRSNIIILRPKKRGGIDESYYIDYSNIISTYLEDKKIKYRPKMFLNPGLFSFIISLAGFKERNIKSIYNLSKTIKLIERSINGYKMLNGYNFSLPEAYNSLLDVECIDNLPFELFLLRFKALDILTLHGIFFDTPECKSIKLTNLYEPETVKMINNRYFISNPLDLERL